MGNHSFQHGNSPIERQSILLSPSNYSNKKMWHTRLGPHSRQPRCLPDLTRAFHKRALTRVHALKHTPSFSCARSVGPTSPPRRLLWEIEAHPQSVRQCMVALVYVRPTSPSRRSLSTPEASAHRQSAVGCVHAEPLSPPRRSLLQSATLAHRKAVYVPRMRSL